MSKKPLTAEDQMQVVAGVFGIAAIVILCMIIAGIILGVMALAKHGLLLPAGIVLFVLFLIFAVRRLITSRNS